MRIDPAKLKDGGWRQPIVLLFLLSAAMAVSMSTYNALLNNFAVERAAFTGLEIGFLHTVREIPGLLAFMFVFGLLFLKEQKLALIALLFLGMGTALMGMFPNVIGLYITTLTASVGFHAFESYRSSLALQWFEKDKAPAVLGRILGVNAAASFATFIVILAALTLIEIDLRYVYTIGGVVTLCIVLFCAVSFPQFKGKTIQRRKPVLRKRYGLYYGLILLAGGRRQINIVFAGFLMVEKFGFDAATMTALLLANYGINMFLAPAIGRLIGSWGERRALMFEYAGLMLVFVGYGLVEVPAIAVGLFIANQLLFAFSIAQRTYFQKIADPADMAGTAGVSSTINHMAAVVLPAILGIIWIADRSSVFFIGAGIAAASLMCASLIPQRPEPGREIVFFRASAVKPAE